MPKYVIEREVPDAGKMSPEQLQAISQKSCSVLRNLGPEIQWIESYVTDNKIYCVYIAANEEMVRMHAQQGGFPANRISEVRAVIDPTTNVSGSVAQTRPTSRCTHQRADLSLPSSISYCRASRRNKNAPSAMNKTFGAQTSNSGWTLGFPRNVSPIITKRK